MWRAKWEGRRVGAASEDTSRSIVRGIDDRF